MHPSRNTLATGMVVLITAAAAACGGTKTVTITVPGEPTTVTAPQARGLGHPRQVLQFGYIRSLTRTGTGYEMRFDPAWFLSGTTANTAAAGDGAVDPGEAVPNDNYVVDESHRLLTYLIPAGARVTVLTNPGHITATPITVAQLAGIVHGRGQSTLFEPIATGFWIAISGDTVHSLDQQYRA
jgi:hypothetical protein